MVDVVEHHLQLSEGLWHDAQSSLIHQVDIQVEIIGILLLVYLLDVLNHVDWKSVVLLAEQVLGDSLVERLKSDLVSCDGQLPLDHDFLPHLDDLNLNIREHFFLSTHLDLSLTMGTCRLGSFNM